MNRTTIQGGMTPTAYYAATNTNFQKSYLGGSFFNVEEYGAIHDNSTDDTVAIQAAINACDVAGGGTVFFPKGFYKIAGALQTNIGGINYNSQLYIPNNIYKVIKLLGEISNLYVQNISDHLYNNGVVLRSTIAGTGINPSVIRSYGYNITEIENISVLVNPFITTGGPSMCGVNLTYSSHHKVKNLICGLDIIDRNTMVQPTNHVFGLAIGHHNGDFPIVDFYTGWGFYYGMVISEGVHAKDIFCYWNYIGLMSCEFYCSAVIDYATLHWNTYDIAAHQETFAGYVPGSSHLIIHHMTSEDHFTQGPAWTNRVDEILDTNNYLYGSMDYAIVGNDGVGAGNNIIKSHGGNNFLIRNIVMPNSSYHWTTAERPIVPRSGCQGYNTTTNKMECWNGSTWNDLF